MKVFYFLFGLTVFWSSNSYSSSHLDHRLTGHYQCKVQTQQIIEVVDGKTNFYGKYVDGYEVGDTLDIRFSWDPLLKGLDSVISDDYRDFSMTFVSKPRIWGKNWLEDDVFSKRLHITEDQIHLSTNGVGSLTLNRYYKSDWGGILIEGMSWGFGNDDKTRVTTLDCRTLKDVHSHLFKFLKEQNLYSTK